MRVLLINQFFYPDQAPTSQMMTDLAEDLATKGVEVTVISGRSPYTGGKLTWKRREVYKGIAIHRTWATAFGRKALLGRLLDYLSFSLTAVLKSLRLPRQDVVITLSTPPWLFALGLLLRWMKGTRWVYWIQDLYPDVAIALGFLRSPRLAAKGLRRLSSMSFAKADQVVALGNFMGLRILERGGASERIAVIPNWADGKRIYPVAPQENWFLAEHDLEGRFVILYSGNMGYVHEFSTSLQAARALRDEPPFLFLFIGDGPRRPEIEAFVERHRLTNVRLLSYQRKEAIPYSLSAGHVHLISLKEGLEGLSVPSKIYGALAAGRPVIYIGPERSEVGQIVQDARCGFIVKEGNVDHLIDVIRMLHWDKALREEMGRRARASFELFFDRPMATERFLKLLEALDNHEA